MDRPHFNSFEPAIAQHTLPPAPASYTSFVDLAGPPARPHIDPNRHQPPHGFQATIATLPIQPFLPPPLRQLSSQSGRTTTTPFTQPARSLFPPAPGPNTLEAAPSSTSCRQFDYITASIYTEEQRATPNMEFLSICLLLTHFSPNFALYDTVHHCPIPPDHNLFLREPCRHARREILANMESSKPTLLHNSGRTYPARILAAQGIDFHQAYYYGALFTQQFFHLLVNVDNWAVSPHVRPSTQFDAASIPTLHVFDLLRAVQTIGPGPSLLHATGLTHLQARHVGTLIFYSFVTLDIKESFKDCPFWASLLGSRLWSWLELLNDSAVLLLWDKFPRTVSYQWMLSYWSLLNVFKRCLQSSTLATGPWVCNSSRLAHAQISNHC
jgi:hypothetical protein